MKDSPDLPSPVKAKNAQNFTNKLQIINELGVKVKGEGKNCELAECAMRGRVSAEAHLHTRENGEGNTTEGGEEEKTGEENGKKAGVLLEKDGRKEGKEDKFRKKIHKFLFPRRFMSRKQNFFSQKLRIFKT